MPLQESTCVLCIYACIQSESREEKIERKKDEEQCSRY